MVVVFGGGGDDWGGRGDGDGSRVVKVKAQEVVLCWWSHYSGDGCFNIQGDGDGAGGIGGGGLVG